MLGIPGDEFVGILSESQGALLDIIKKPAPFLGNLLKAVQQGLDRFLSNFGQRLIAGLTSWLFGQIASGGITLPTSFDLPSIFMLVLQVLGLTATYIRSRVVRRIGEKAMHLVEKAMEPIQLMFTEGPAAVWEWLKDEADKAKTAIIEAASQWLITQIITQATIKLASMFTPAGAFVQAVMTLYNTVMFFVEKIKEILAWVKSITASFKSIAQGAIGAAAEYIDGTMSKSIPLLIAFFARFLGLGDIGEKIRDVVAKLRTPVDRAVDFLIDKVIAGAKAVGGAVKGAFDKGVKKVKDWWDDKIEFRTQDGEVHHLFLDEVGGHFRPIVSSSEKTDVNKAAQEQKDAGDATPDQVKAVETQSTPLAKTTTTEATHSKERPKGQASLLATALSKFMSLGKKVAEQTLKAGEELLAGALWGDFVEDPSYWNMIGQMIAGASPIGPLADFRDVVASLKSLILDKKYNCPEAWLNLVLNLIGFIPALGDGIKLGGKAAIKWLKNAKLTGRLLEQGKGVVKKTVEATKAKVGKLWKDAKDWIKGKFIKNSGNKGQAPRRFESPDPLVADIANAIEARYPGHVVGVNVKTGGLELDIVTRNAIIEVKKGGAGLTRQVTARLTGAANPNNLPVIGHSPELGKHAAAGINDAGGIASNDLSTLLDVIKP